MRNTNVEYIERFEEGEDGVKLPVKIYKSVINSYIRRFENCTFALAGLGSCSRDLMDFLTEQMDENNVVNSDGYMREKFMTFIKTITGGKVEYGDSSVKKSFKVLADRNLIRQVRRGVFKVNPEYFFKGEDNKIRINMIISELKVKYGEENIISVKKENINE